MISESRKKPGTLAGSLAVVAWLVLVLGLFFHHSASPAVFGRFSSAYAVGLLLVALATPFVFLSARALATPSVVTRPSAPPMTVRPATKLTLLVASLCVAFLLAQLLPEASARRRTAFRYLPHPYLQSVPAPDRSRGINARGFRGEEAVLPKALGAFRVVLLGGSTTFDPSLDYADSYGKNLEEILRRSLRHPGDVQVAAVPGFNSEHDLIRYAADAADLEADAVLVMVAVNDLYACVESHDAFRRDYGHLRGLGNTRVQLLRDRTGLLQTATWYARAVLFSDFRRPPAWEVEQVSPDPGPFLRNLAAIAAIARSRGQKLVLCTQPHRFRLDVNAGDQLRGDAALRNFRNGLPLPGFVWFCREEARFNEETRALAARAGLPLLDFERLIPSQASLFFDEVHVTPAGALLEAEAAARFLLEQGLLR